MLKTILIVLAVIVLAIIALVIFASTKPDTFHVERSIIIAAPPEKIVPLINDFHQWQAWSPYEKLDPAMTRTISGAPAGQGATYAWSGSGKAGAGQMEIVESSVEKIVIKLDFSKPFEAHNIATFTLIPATAGTAITWAMDGPAPLIAKVMGLVFSMDEMIGKDFAAGLENLKAIAEK
ncbi:carbon monoxide dehydrogenase subunit G [Pararhizobium capsulatum DSM 1112]|uniref:Carbon monoxide dehydrogenase subunit G n=1 Tax=Pararhizobium capsulatum DSM 1112 TaxID=1121113 RepID=A0ABU0BUI4_9HYPH|nr:SRPBCC family protein [Pararhizobium capsulatum]MDQ0321916.1 carbon monoxide dehydrogenase subunit G [Pararhizobium capsulatum DSM 1112]